MKPLFDGETLTYEHPFCSDYVITKWQKSDAYCPNCGEQLVLSCQELWEDNCGYQHICTVCGWGFMATGETYLDIPVEAAEALYIAADR